MSALKSNKILIAVIVAALATAAFWFLGLSPKREEAAQLQTEIAAKQTELEQAQASLTGYLKARDEYRANYTTFVRLGKALPADDDIRSLMVQLDSASARTNVDFAKLEVGSASGGDSSEPVAVTPGQLAPAPGTVQVGSTGISAMPFTLQFKGRFFNLSNFFNDLDRFVSVHNEKVKATGRLLRVETITLHPSADGYPEMDADVGAASYLVSAPQPGVTPAASSSTATPASSSSSSGGSTTPTTTTATVTGAVR